MYNLVMFNKLKNFFIRPSKYDKAIFGVLEDNLKSIDVLNSHLIAIARLTLITPSKLLKEINNVQANTEYLESLIKARDAESK